MTRSKPCAAFIRAIGPETHNVMPLPKLCAACGKLGLRDVKSYIASGNLYFRSGFDVATSAQLVSKAITGFGLQNEVFALDASDLDTIITANPFPNAARERPNQVAAILFDHSFDQELVNALLAYDGPEKLVVQPHVVYVDYAQGLGGSKITPGVIERRLKLKGTARNWNTILKMRELIGAMED